MMPCILQAHASRVKFDSASLTNANMRDTNPSLNVIQPKDGSSKRPREELTSEQKRFDKNVALNQAYQDHKSLNKIKNKDLSAKDFFNKSKAKRATSAHGPVRVGTDCSGMEIPIQALQNLGVGYEHIFSCDTDADSKAVIEANFPSQVFYPDITTRDNSSAANVDLYVAGFPCQPFSTAGKRMGTQDARGTIVFNVIDYINKQRPKVFILENVQGFITQDDGKTCQHVMQSLLAIGKVGETPTYRSISSRKISGSTMRGAKHEGGAYEIHDMILNTSDHGVPQHRRRWYCVGFRKSILQSKKPFDFKFPTKIPCPSIEKFLDKASEGQPLQPVVLSNTAKANIAEANRQIKKQGLNPDKRTYVVNCDASTSSMKWYDNISPCITRSRSTGHWLTSRHRKMSLDEMLRLQGIVPGQFKFDLPDKKVGQLIGNAMSVNVVERIIKRALEAADLIPQGNTVDRWENGSAMDALRMQRATSSRKQRTVCHLKCNKYRQYIIDSGASLHMVARKSLSRKEQSSLRRTSEPLQLQTANGIVLAEWEVEVEIIPLKVKLWALVLDNTPSVLSLGRLIEDEKFSFSQKPGVTPFLYKAGMNNITCPMTHHVPYLTSIVDAEGNLCGKNRKGSALSGAKEPKEKKKEVVKVEDTKVPIKRGRPKDKVAKRTSLCKPGDHNLFTHFPKDPNCEVCQSCKSTRAHCKSSKAPDAENLPTPLEFADALTADHAILNEEDKSRTEDRNVCVILDRYTQWMQAYAAPTKSSYDNKKAFQRFLGPQTKPKHVYTDNSEEFKLSMTELEFSHDTSTPHRPQTNGIAERAVRRVKEGTSCALHQSGLTDKWWVSAMKCYCFLHCIVTQMFHGKTAYKQRFKKEFAGPIIPYGAAVEYLPITKKDKAKCHKLGGKLLKGIFLGYVQHAGGGWTGDLRVIDQEEINEATLVSEVYPKRFKSSEVFVRLRKEKVYFPLAEGNLSQPGLDAKRAKRIKKSKSPEDEESDDDEEEVKVDPAGGNTVQHEPDYWTLNDDVLVRVHRTPRQRLFTLDEVELPIPKGYIDILRKTVTDLEIMSESSINDFWSDAGDRELSGFWHGKTIFQLFRPAPEGWQWQSGRCTRIQKTTRPPTQWVENWKDMNAKDKQKAIDEWAVEGPKRQAAREARGVSKLSIKDEEYDAVMKAAKEKLKVPDAPAMPLVLNALSAVSNHGKHRKNHIKHQDHIAAAGTVSPHYYALVHTPVPIPKAMKIPAAKAAVDKEWKKLQDKTAWDFASVRPKSEVQAESKRSGKHAHFGSLMDLCHEKHSELKLPVRVYKGRVVFRGDQTKDEDGFFAVFSEQGASASHIAAAKFLDALARCPGCDGEDSDAIGAYTQVILRDAHIILGGNNDNYIETWISLPRERRPKHWDSIDKPVCKLRLNLYGHPMAGLIWEKWCDKAITDCGFEKILSWECLYVHPIKQLFLSVYVDDFKMSGNKANIKDMWKSLGQKIDLEPPVPLDGNVYLGCGQTEIRPDKQLVAEKAQLMIDLMEGKRKPSAESNLCPDDFKKDIPTKSKGVVNKVNKKRSTIKPPGLSGQVKSALLASDQIKIRSYQYEMSGHAESCVERYLDLSKMKLESLKQVATPCIDDHQLQAEDFTTPGKLSPVAARIVLKALYLARIGRPDALWAVNTLAREVTKWTVACDKRLLRLISYLHFTKDWVQTCFVGDKPQECWIAMFVDASFAGDLQDSKSTSGMYLCLVGPHTFVPISWLCKKQGAVSHSSTESEVISLEASLRTEGIPALALWEKVVQVFSGKQLPQKNSIKNNTPKVFRDADQALLDHLSNVDHVPCTIPLSNGDGQIVCFEDNEAVIKMTIKGRSPNMRHVQRSHRVNLDWLFDRMAKDPGIRIKYVGTKQQIADILTKGSFTAEQWKALCRLAQIAKCMKSKSQPLREALIAKYHNQRKSGKAERKLIAIF